MDLTARETEVLRLVYLLRSNNEIAERLSISKHTVKVHLNSIFRKLGVSDRMDLAILADAFLASERYTPTDAVATRFPRGPITENSHAAPCLY